MASSTALFLLLAKIQNVAIGLGIVQHAVGARKCLNQSVILEGFYPHTACSGIWNRSRSTACRPQSPGQSSARAASPGWGIADLYPFLHILIVQIKFIDAVIRAIAGVIVRNDGLQCGLLFVRFYLVVGFFLRQVFLNLLDILVALGRRRKDTGNIQRLKVSSSAFFLPGSS